ncbi:MAG: protein-L-isoaspartate(D-aspartate) O-methyltransferase [Litorivicinus sp.]
MVPLSRDANTEARHRLVLALKTQGCDERVAEAFWQVKRHHYIEPALAFRAYEDVTLPIGFQQTLSRPSVVAHQLSEMVKQRKRLRYVLEIGTGSGYQTALLTRLCTRVYSVERLGGLHQIAAQRLGAEGYRNYRLRLGDGFEGWPQAGPFDAIIAAASPKQVPQTWIDQLAVGGVLIMPLDLGHRQIMIRVDKTAEGIEQTQIAEASFVPCLPGVRG